MGFTQELAKILADVDRPGDYFATGRADFMVPRIEVDRVGPSRFHCYRRRQNS